MDLSAIILICTVLLLFVMGFFAVYQTQPKRAWIYFIVFFAVVASEMSIAIKGFLQNWTSFPPPFVFFFLFFIFFPLGISFGSFGKKLAEGISIQWLVGFQSFRLLAELVIHFAWEAGIAPIQLSFHGYNFDILVAIAALNIAFIPKLHQNLKVVWAWNIFGILSLLNIAFIAATSMPTPLRLFMQDPDNTWVTYPPFILLPGVLVVAAILGHALLTQKLLKQPRLEG